MFLVFLKFLPAAPYNSAAFLQTLLTSQHFSLFLHDRHNFIKMPTRLHPAKVHSHFFYFCSCLSVAPCLFPFTSSYNRFNRYFVYRWFSLSAVLFSVMRNFSVLSANKAEATAHAQCVVKQFPSVTRHFDSVVSCLSHSPQMWGRVQCFSSFTHFLCMRRFSESQTSTYNESICSLKSAGPQVSIILQKYL